MSSLKTSNVYLVGSMAVPSDTVEEAMRLAASKLGGHLSALPDGEVGKRSFWVAGLGMLTYSKHPQIEKRPDAVAAPRPATAAESEGDALVQSETYPDDMGQYRLKPGVTHIDLEGYLPYAEAAISSYQVFRKLKDSGELPGDVRFQVDLPTPNAAVYPFFTDTSEWPVLMAAWQRAAKDEIRKILEVVPAGELALQWDYCVELVGILQAASGLPAVSQRDLTVNETPEETFARLTGAAYIGPMSDGVPDEVRFGFHMCLGTFPKFPSVHIDDLALVVRAANQLVKHSPHRVDFLHMPAVAEADRDFFAPLKDLKVGDAKIFLGVGHRDSRESIATRAKAAREFLPNFGISHYCGYGRDDRHHFGELLSELKGAADILASDHD